jgi:hypothetical protein
VDFKGLPRNVAHLPRRKDFFVVIYLMNKACSEDAAALHIGEKKVISMLNSAADQQGALRCEVIGESGEPKAYILMMVELFMV